MSSVWLASLAIGALALGTVGVACWGVARLLPPGRGREVVGFGPNCAILLRRLQRDDGLRLSGRVALGAALGYLISPIQLVPNFVPVIGQVDDVAVVAMALRYCCRQLPPDEVEAAWPGDPAVLRRLLGRHAPGAFPDDEKEPRCRGVAPSLVAGPCDIARGGSGGSEVGRRTRPVAHFGTATSSRERPSAS